MYSLLNETRICQVCKRMFPNGKALGGHMRSHTRTQKLSVLSHKSQPGASSSTAPPLQVSNIPAGASFNPNETVLVRSVHSGGPKPDLSEESGEESAGKRKFLWDLNEVCPTESQSCLTDEEAASWLLELSEGSVKDVVKPSDSSSATRKGKEKVEYIDITDSEDDVDDEERYYRYLDKDEDIKDEENVKILTSEDKEETETVTEDKDEDKDDESYSVAKEKKGKKKYKCNICNKVLRSYQALGGHRTSHTNKRMKMLLEKDDAEASNPQDGPVLVRRHFECEICGKVFTSGQALGGHKKVHYVFLKPCNEAN